METLKACQETCREMTNNTVRISPLENLLVKIVSTVGRFIADNQRVNVLWVVSMITVSFNF